MARLTGIHDPAISASGVELFQNKPNPFDESTIISFFVHDPAVIGDAIIRVTDPTGRLIKELPVPVKEGMNEVVYTHGYNMVGTYFYTLYLNQRLVDTKKMVFSN